MKTFDKEKFDNITHCEYCNYKFDKDYNDRKIELYERVDKNKLKYIIDNYKFNEETKNTLKLYYESLNKKGQKKVIYKQSKDNKNRYFGGICLTSIKRKVRNSIMPNNILDIDMENSHPRILLYLCKKHKINCEKLNEYINNREYFLSRISNNRKEAKTLILQMMNGGFKNKYSDNDDVNKFLKDFELEIKIGITSEKFKSIEFKFKEYEMDDDGEAHEIKNNYSLKVIDSYNLLMGSLDNLSTNLNNKYKYETKKEFRDTFELINKKMNFPYEWINEDNLNNKELPEIKDFYSSLKLESISEKEYEPN